MWRPTREKGFWVVSKEGIVDYLLHQVTAIRESLREVREGQAHVSELKSLKETMRTLGWMTACVPLTLRIRCEMNCRAALRGET